MATTTKIVIGIPRDGETSATAGTLAKKINDITTCATSFTLDIAVKGRKLYAVIVYS
jgi:hypothetical protein